MSLKLPGATLPDHALDHCRRLELAVMGADLKALKEEEEADRLRPRSVFRRGRADRASLRTRASDDDHLYDETDQDEEYEEAMERIATRLRNARRNFLLTIEHDRRKRRAWELLVGPVDWDRVADFDLPWASDRGGMPDMTDPSMTVPAQAGMLAELTGQEAHPAIRFFEALGKAADDLTEEEKDPIAAHIDELKKQGWVQQPDGSWRRATHAVARDLADEAKAKAPSVRSPRDKPRHPRLRLVE